MCALLFGGLQGCNPTISDKAVNWRFTLQFAGGARVSPSWLRPAPQTAHCCGVTPPHSPRGGLGTHSGLHFTCKPTRVPCTQTPCRLSFYSLSFSATCKSSLLTSLNFSANFFINSAWSSFDLF